MADNFAIRQAITHRRRQAAGHRRTRTAATSRTDGRQSRACTPTARAASQSDDGGGVRQVKPTTQAGQPAPMSHACTAIANDERAGRPVGKHDTPQGLRDEQRRPSHRRDDADEIQGLHQPMAMQANQPRGCTIATTRRPATAIAEQFENRHSAGPASATTGHEP